MRLAPLKLELGFGLPWGLWLASVVLCVSALMSACLRPPQGPEPAPAGSMATPLGTAPFMVGAPLAMGSQATSPQIPIGVHDPIFGSSKAPCTIVTFQDLECPFCGRSWQTLMNLERQYGPERLRFVYKHFPLPFHDDALPAARVAQAVFDLKGSQAFRDFISKVFEMHGDMSDERLRTLAKSVGAAGKDFDNLLLDQNSVVWKKLDDDAVLARMLNVQGTPHFFINGVRVVGAQPIEEFKRVIDAELAAAANLQNAGTKSEDIFAARVKANLALEPEEERVQAGKPGLAPADSDATVYDVPVDHQPMEGPSDAPVTVVEFIDYQCPFCRAAEVTRQQLLKKYRGQVRFVIRHNPLPFHPRATPAARLAIEVYKQKGNQAFWETHRRLLETENLDDARLLAIADATKLDRNRAKRVIEAAAHQDILDDDAALASALKATGTPHFFINGIRVTGAQPLETFTQVIDEQLKKAQGLTQKGTAPSAVYTTLMKQAVRPDPYERKSVPLPDGKNPQRGPASAPVVVNVFVDFQCPFCTKLPPILSELERDFPGKLRIVYRSRPLPFHKQARPAAEAALEAFKQRGNPGFWKMFDRLFEVQSQYGALELPELERYAREQGLDVDRFRHALNEHEHESEIAADESIADREDISGTPACVINGLFISGAQPVGNFKQAVRSALPKH